MLLVQAVDFELGERHNATDCYVAKVVDIGHSDVAMTLRYYVDVFPEDLEEAAEMLAERYRYSERIHIEGNRNNSRYY